MDQTEASLILDCEHVSFGLTIICNFEYPFYTLHFSTILLSPSLLIVCLNFSGKTYWFCLGDLSVKNKVPYAFSFLYMLELMASLTGSQWSVSKTFGQNFCMENHIDLNFIPTLFQCSIVQENFTILCQNLGDYNYS